MGIETSCDETSAAILKAGRKILSNVIASSLPLHQRFGGIIPEIASRAHLEQISRVSEIALRRARIKIRDIGLICVTNEPGLTGALLVGLSFSRALALARNIPYLEINHLKAHIYASLLGKGKTNFPFIGFVISGGHTNMFLVKDILHWREIASTRDDAVGESYDKVAKILGLGFPGGPIIEKRALQGNPHKIKLTCANLENSLDFSFSGIKTAVLYKCRELERFGSFKENIDNLAASFQENVISVLVQKALTACKKYKIKNLSLGGGVTVNNFLRKKLVEAAKAEKINVLFPEKELCLDNAAMIAGLGYGIFKYQSHN